MNENLIKKILAHYGIQNQKKKAIEEMSELIVVMCKTTDVPSCDPKLPQLMDNLIEEIADVMIMMEQLRLFYGQNEVDKMIEYKLNRQIKRIEAGV